MHPTLLASPPPPPEFFVIFALVLIATVALAVPASRKAEARRKLEEQRRVAEEDAMDAERSRVHRELEEARLRRIHAQLSAESGPAKRVEKEKILEQQVVVARCRYCDALTPVDLSECEGCGARL